MGGPKKTAQVKKKTSETWIPYYFSMEADNEANAILIKYQSPFASVYAPNVPGYWKFNPKAGFYDVKGLIKDLYDHVKAGKYEIVDRAFELITNPDDSAEIAVGLIETIPKNQLANLSSALLEQLGLVLGNARKGAPGKDSAITKIKKDKVQKQAVVDAALIKEAIKDKMNPLHSTESAGVSDWFTKWGVYAQTAATNQTKAKYENKVENKAADLAAETEAKKKAVIDDKKILDAINSNREKIKKFYETEKKEFVEKELNAKKVKPGGKRSDKASENTRYFYGGKPPLSADGKLLIPEDIIKVDKTITKGVTKSGEFLHKILTVLWNELGSEGKLSSINTYDSEKFTWATGFAGGGGGLPRLLKNLINSNAIYKNMFLNMGVYADMNYMYTVDVKTGEVLYAYKAAAEVQDDYRLVYFFIELGENPTYNSNVLSALFTSLRQTAGNFPDYIYKKDVTTEYSKDWSDRSIACAAHLNHWLTGCTWAEYEKTGGNTLKVLLEFLKQNAGTTMSKEGVLRLFAYDEPIRHLNPIGKGAGETNQGVMAKIVKTINSNKLYNLHVMKNMTAFTDEEKLIFVKGFGTDDYYAIPGEQNLVGTEPSGFDFSSMVTAPLQTIYTSLNTSYATALKSSHQTLAKKTEIENLIAGILSYNSMNYIEELDLKINSSSATEKTEYDKMFEAKQKVAVKAAKIFKKYGISGHDGFAALKPGDTKTAIKTALKTLKESADYKGIDDKDKGKIYLESFK